MSPHGCILLVENDKIQAKLIHNQLVRLGYSVAGVVASGEDAIAFASERQPDLVLMDIGLEGDMDGVDAAAAIRRRTGIPIVFLTSSDDNETVDRARFVEAHGYLHKPLQEREVYTTLQLALYKAEMEARLREESSWLATLLRCITDGVIATDASGALRFLNPTAEKLTGWTEQAALGRDLSEIFHVLEPASREPAECELTRVLLDDTAQGAISHKLLVSRTGTETLVEESARCITNDSGQTVGVLLVFRALSSTTPHPYEAAQEDRL
jgi:PAS domain S-box-containing protein